MGYVRGSMEGQLAEWLEAAERARAYYRRSGWSASGLLEQLGAALFHGPTPAGQALERCEQLLDETTDRLGEANVLVYLGGLQGLSGRFEDAFRSIGDADLIYRDLGMAYARADNVVRIAARMYRLAGEAEEAERVLRESCEVFERADDKAALSTIASELGQALYVQERYADAAEWGRRAEKYAPIGDLVAQFSWRGLRGKLLAHEGRFHEGEALASQAVGIVERTDALSSHGEVLLDYAEVLRMGGRRSEAARPIEQAVALFERKENVPAARLARSRLDALAIA
jgi:tetratricopeptide (TPR) repeat protein